MKQLSCSIIIGILAITCFGFSTATKGLNATFGVSENDPSQIELKLHDNFTFSYQDLSNSTNAIYTQGKYSVKNETIFLDAVNNTVDFHSKWKLSDDGTIAKSRKGMCFYRLMKK